MIPDGKGPFPVFLTNHARNRPWIYTAVRRGYIAAIYHATDPELRQRRRLGRVDRDLSRVRLVVPGAVGVGGVAHGRLPRDAARGGHGAKIGLAGHSRNGKQALLAAAFDERIGAVVPSSGNSGELDPWRYTTEPFANESIELLAGVQSHWFHPRLRFFAGREDKLPVDQNSLMALVAPRGLMMYSGYAESAGNPFGFEQAYRSALRVYQFLGREQNIWLQPARGGTRDHRGRRRELHRLLRRRLRPPRAAEGRDVDSRLHVRRVAEAVGREHRPGVVPGQPLQPRRRRGGAAEADRVGARRGAAWRAQADSAASCRRLVPATAGSRGCSSVPEPTPTARARVVKEGMGWAEIPFGDDLKADLFYPADKPGGKWPVVIWLHPYSVSERMVERVAVGVHRVRTTGSSSGRRFRRS